MSSNQTTQRCHDLDDMAWQEAYLTKDIRQNLVAMTIINSVTAILTIVLNTMVIAAVITRRQLRSNSNLLLACLAGTDLMAGALVQPLSIASDIKHILGMGPYCDFDHAIDFSLMFVCLASLNHLTLISIERYVAIKHALMYHDIVTDQRLKVGVLLAWAVSVVEIIPYILLAIADNPEYSAYYIYIDTTLVAIGVVNISTIFYSSLYIYSETQRQNKRLQGEQVTQEAVERFKKESKSAKTATIILSAVLLSYLPTFVLSGIFIILDKNVEDGVSYVLFAWCDTCIMLGSLLNPIVYCWRLEKFRSAFLEMLHLRQPQNSHDVELMHIPPQPQQSAIQPLTCIGQDPVLLSLSTLQPSNPCI